MCMLCIEVAKENMTFREIAGAYAEMTIEPEHIAEILVTIEKHSDLKEVGQCLLEIINNESLRN